MVNMRQLRQLELTKTDALMLRELIRPFDHILPDFIKGTLTELSKKIYAALIELEHEETINIPINEEEILLLNQKISNEEWDGAQALLLQTWKILYEIKEGNSPSVKFEIKELLNQLNTKFPDENEGELVAV